MRKQGSGQQVLSELSRHEKAGLCNLYPPRPNGDAMPFQWGEVCTADAQCASGLCIEPFNNEGIGLGYCTQECDLSSDCPAGYVCGLKQATGQKFCAPGPNFSGPNIATGGGCQCDQTFLVCDAGCDCDPDCVGDRPDDPLNPDDLGNLDLCTPCGGTSDGCLNGLCFGDDTLSLCTDVCVPGQFGCPDGFDCIPTTVDDVSVCWPRDLNSCSGAGQGGQLNELCFVENLSNPSDPFFSPCAGALSCFGFKPRCEGQRGECVEYCNATDTPCSFGRTCCFGLRADGSCVRDPSPDNLDGGCFDIRHRGETCVVAEQSVCEDGTECFFFSGESTLARCYQSCAVTACANGLECVTAEDACLNNFAVCCEENALSNGLCDPGPILELSPVGLICDLNEECDSGICLKLDGRSACSQPCSLADANTCPPDGSDVNGDGEPDGDFQCRVVDTGSTEQGMCWPDQGPICPADGCDDADPTPPSGGCSCDAIPIGWGTGLIFLAATRRRLRKKKPIVGDGGSRQ